MKFSERIRLIWYHVLLVPAILVSPKAFDRVDGKISRIHLDIAKRHGSGYE